MDRLDALLADVEDEVGLDLDGLLDHSACERLVRVTRLHDLTAALLSRTLAEVDERKATDILYGARPSMWLTNTTKVSATTIGRRARTAAKLRHLLDEVDAAWAAGRLTEDHVKVFHDAANPRIKHEIAALQTKLIDLAQRYTFHHWRLLMANIVHELDQDGAFDPDAERERNTASFATTLDGDCTLNARFDRLLYARLKPLVDTKADELFRHFSRTRDASGNKVRIPSRGCLRALALVELAEAGAAAGANGRPVPGATFVLTPDLLDTTDGDENGAVAEPNGTHADHAARFGTTDHGGRARPWWWGFADGADTMSPDPVGPAAVGAGPSEPRHPADSAVARADLPHHGRASGTPPSSSRRSQPRLDTGRISGWRAWTLDGLLLPGANPDLAAQLCDATTGTLLLDLDGSILSMGRTARLFKPDQRTAMAIRDGGCVMPGCSMPPDACRAHHLDEWVRDHGNTDVIVGALLCDRDHGIPHRDGWYMFITLDGWTWLKPPTGPSFWGQRHGIQRAGPTPDQPGYAGPPSINLAARHLDVSDPTTSATGANADRDDVPRRSADAGPPPAPNPTSELANVTASGPSVPDPATVEGRHRAARPRPRRLERSPDELADCDRTLARIRRRLHDDLVAEPP